MSIPYFFQTLIEFPGDPRLGASGPSGACFSTKLVRRTLTERGGALGRCPRIHYTGRKGNGAAFMALKPPPIGDVLQQVSGLMGDDGLKGEVDRNARLLVQAALDRLDVVSREEFDAQSEQLARTRARVRALESELAALTESLAALERRRAG